MIVKNFLSTVNGDIKIKREDLLNAIEDLKRSENIERDIDILKDLAITFCDIYEDSFVDIKEGLSVLSPHIDLVYEAHEIAEECAKRLY